MTVLQHASGTVWYLQLSGYLALSCRDCHLLLLFCWHSPCSHSLPSSFGACLPCPVPHTVKKTGLFLPLTHKIALWTRYHAKVNVLVFCTTKKQSTTAGKVTYTLRRGFGQGFFFFETCRYTYGIFNQELHNWLQIWTSYENEKNMHV